MSSGFQGFLPDRLFLPGWAYLQEKTAVALHTQGIILGNGWELHCL